jgi:hypothetical protein
METWRGEGAISVCWLHGGEQWLGIQQTSNEHKRDVYIFGHTAAMVKADRTVGTIKHGDTGIATTIKFTSNGIRGRNRCRERWGIETSNHAVAKVATCSNA